MKAPSSANLTLADKCWFATWSLFSGQTTMMSESGRSLFTKWGFGHFLESLVPVLLLYVCLRDSVHTHTLRSLFQSVCVVFTIQSKHFWHSLGHFFEIAWVQGAVVWIYPHIIGSCSLSSVPALLYACWGISRWVFLLPSLSSTHLCPVGRLVWLSAPWSLSFGQL